MWIRIMQSFVAEMKAESSLLLSRTSVIALNPLVIVWRWYVLFWRSVVVCLTSTPFGSLAMDLADRDEPTFDASRYERLEEKRYR